ncbi:MAG: TlpA disulfide reductase family protein [Bacteroidales bacterium]|nr:TlpA disulfide reductase family protein [Bacteroidales bacterium]MDD3527179.1 TlpA disulfide reductase family protein [Bacteroidales bacterium]MDD4176147.1 TlpA disulfide reductase family protein [Bacteroidales bacterium]MDD4740566.1 TlpA disulfide reductase family protein [Bacteroidales bacterium]
MKNYVFLLAALLFVTIGYSQSENKALFSLPEVDIQTVQGEPFNTKQIHNDGKPVIITFWATWCKPCMKEHDAINEVYEDWVDETGVKLYAVSIDNARSSKRVLPTVNGRSWEFDVLLDPNGDLKRAMNVNIPPHTFILNGNGDVVWQHVGYLEGDEHEYIEIVKKIAAGKKID